LEKKDHGGPCRRIQRKGTNNSKKKKIELAPIGPDGGIEFEGGHHQGWKVGGNKKGGWKRPKVCPPIERTGGTTGSGDRGDKTGLAHIRDQ